MCKPYGTRTLSPCLKHLKQHPEYRSNSICVGSGMSSTTTSWLGISFYHFCIPIDVTEKRSLGYKITTRQHCGGKHSCKISKHSFDQGSYFIQRRITYRCGMLLNGAKTREIELSLTRCKVYVLKLYQDCLKPFEQILGWFGLVCFCYHKLL